jgi:hypothetical protein
MSNTVALSLSISLSDAEKLNVLRRLDQFRQWHSLDDKRYCLVCGKIITGSKSRWQAVVGITVRYGLAVPRSVAIPMDWVLPTDEILARVEMLAAKEHEPATSTPINHGRMPERPHETHHGIAAQLRNFASYVNRHP